MVYQSPFDFLNERKRNLWKEHNVLGYSGTIENILHELIESSTSVTKSDTDYFRILLHPSRIILGVINQKVANPEDEVLFELLQKAIDFNLSAYSNYPNISKPLCELIRDFNSQENVHILNAPVNHRIDEFSWRAYMPHLSQASADKLSIKTRSKDILLVALANGGVIPGADIFLRYIDAGDLHNSEFYAARFSYKKRKEPIPQLTEKEIIYLRERSIGRQLVLFDEDISSGETMIRAKKYFTEEITDGSPVMILTNMDSKKRPELNIL